MNSKIEQKTEEKSPIIMPVLETSKKCFPIPQQETGDSSPMAMLQTAVARGADLAYVEKLMDLVDRNDKKLAEQHFVSAMAAFKADAPALVKNKTVYYETNDKGPVTYDYAGLAQVASKIADKMADFGLSHSWKTSQADGGNITVTCLIRHVGGHSEEVSLTSIPDASGSKNGIQSIASTITYLERYTLLAATGLAAEDMDDDGMGAGKAGPQLINDDQAMEIVAEAKEKGININIILRRYKLEDIRNLDVSQFDRVINQIKQTTGKKTDGNN